MFVIPERFTNCRRITQCEQPCHLNPPFPYRLSIRITGIQSNIEYSYLFLISMLVYTVASEIY